MVFSFVALMLKVGYVVLEHLETFVVLVSLTLGKLFSTSSMVLVSFLQ